MATAEACAPELQQGVPVLKLAGASAGGADLAFGDLRLHRIQAEALAHNRRSQRVLERLGFEEYGMARSYMHIAGQWQDDVLYELLTPTPDRVATYS